MDVLHCDRKLFLVFEYLDYDLKKYMDRHAPTGIPVPNAKVSMKNLSLCARSGKIMISSSNKRNLKMKWCATQQLLVLRQNRLHQCVHHVVGIIRKIVAC